MNSGKKVALLLIAIVHCSSLVGMSTFGKTHFIAGFKPGQKPPSGSALPQHQQNKPVRKGHQPFLINADGSIRTTLFSPDDKIRDALVYLINNEQQYIHMAVFMFTDKEIAQALLHAHRRGVGIMLITDPTNLKDKANKIGMLADHGIPVFVYNAHTTTSNLSSSIMHHKFLIFGKNIADKRIVWTGSLNLTRTAFECNQENILIQDDLDVVEKFVHQFERLKQRSYFYQSTQHRSGANYHAK